jgi:LCP family protein required for cell wall assembly
MDPPDFDDEVRPTKRKRRKDPMWARLLVIFGAVLMVGGGGGIVAVRLAITSATSKIQTTDLIARDSGALATGTSIDGAVNLLLVGIDTEVNSGAGRPGVLSDSIVIMHIPKTHDAAYLISIPRDTKVSVPANQRLGFRGQNTEKINAVFGIGYRAEEKADEKKKRANGVEMLANTLNKLIGGMQFQGAMLVDFDGFRSIIDELGGIDLCVDQKAESIHLAKTPDGKIVDVWYDELAGKVKGLPLGAKVVVHEKGCRTFDSKLALDFARIRYSLDGGDYDRQRNQQKVIKAMAKKAASKEMLTDLGRINRIVEAAGKAVLLDHGNVPLEDFLFTMKDVAANDLTMIKTNAGEFASEDINGVNYQIMTPDSLRMLTAAKEGRLPEFLVQHPQFQTAE